ncbi:hypothetical protein ACTOB_006664 [Actinoplanes oblitus]|uniref:Suppressor of fused-like domain-containing protein n=1 Tax=Actinoplanes oblitus TaxID=3040509 RepID=A0ABY8WC26_9ACTN|nr:hypothetical protein [Actinoplanes oblitus]WIM94623.1 hypothetical protein ACTOB_006664 [Actinoplanes oblitus]
MEIELWSVVAEPEALALAGPGATLLAGTDAAFAVGPDTLVVIGRSDSGAAMVLSEPFPELVEERLAGVLRPAVHAFARLPEGCLALGVAQAAELSYRRGALHDIRLSFETPIPPDLLGQVTPELDWLEPAGRDPIAAMERFIAGWYAGVAPVQDVPAGAGPAALRAFHRAAAGRPEVYGRSCRIFPEPLPGRPDGLLTFGQEGDGVFALLMDPEGDDPRVYYDGLSDRLLPERERLAGYLLHAALVRAAMDGPLGGMAFVDRPQARRIVAPLRRVPLRPMRWPSLFTRCYAGPGMVVVIGEDDADWYEMYVGVRHPGLLRRLRKLGLDWESFTDGS